MILEERHIKSVRGPHSHSEGMCKKSMTVDNAKEVSKAPARDRKIVIVL